MSLVLRLISLNIPLSAWRKFEEDSKRGGEGFRGQGWSSKKVDEIVRIMVASCSHSDAVELIAREWSALPDLIRMNFTMKANDAAGTASGNITKGILTLDKRLGGKILSTVDDRSTMRDLRVIDGELVSREKRVDPAAAGAQRAFGGFVKPANYNQLRPAEKRRIMQKMAAERRTSR